MLPLVKNMECLKENNMKKTNYIYLVIITMILTSCTNVVVWHIGDILWLVLVLIVIIGIMGIMLVQWIKNLFKRK